MSDTIKLWPKILFKIVQFLYRQPHQDLEGVVHVLNLVQVDHVEHVVQVIENM